MIYIYKLRDFRSTNMKNKIYKKLLKQGKYKELSEKLADEKFDFSLDSLQEKFNGISIIYIYSFLNFWAVYRPSIDIYFLICEFLMFFPPFTEDYCILVGFYLRLIFSKYSKEECYDIKKWAVTLFGDSPDSPFSCEEMKKIEDDL